MKLAALLNTAPNSSHQKIAQCFSKAAATYENTALLQREIGHELLKLVPTQHTFDTSLDLGCGSAYFSNPLKCLLPKTSLISLDISKQMLEQAATKNLNSLLCANMEELPFFSQSIDLCFANMSLQWSSNLAQNLQEIYRVLKKGACCLFSIPGPGTLLELKRSWSTVDQGAHVNEFCNQLALHSSLLATQFKDITISNKHYVLEYPSVVELMQQLKTTGTTCVLQQQKSLSGKHKFKAMLAAYEEYRQANHLLPCTYDIIFVRAYK